MCKHIITSFISSFLPSAQLLPSWNLTVTHTTSSSLTVKWSKFPLTNVFIQRFLVNYREHNSNVSLIFKAPNSYNTHYTGTLLKSYQFYDVQVIAVTSVGNGTYSSQTEPTRTDEGGKHLYKNNMSIELRVIFFHAHSESPTRHYYPNQMTS